MAIIDIYELRRLSADAESLLLFCKRPGLCFMKSCDREPSRNLHF